MEKIEAQITNMEEEEATMTTTITFILPVIATGVEKTAATKKNAGSGRCGGGDQTQKERGRGGHVNDGGGRGGGEGGRGSERCWERRW